MEPNSVSGTIMPERILAGVEVEARGSQTNGLVSCHFENKSLSVPLLYTVAADRMASEQG